MAASKAYAFRLWTSEDDECSRWLDEQIANRAADTTRSERLREIVVELVAGRCGQTVPKSARVLDADAFSNEVARRVIELQRTQS